MDRNTWIINTNLDIPSHLPIRSPHTPPETQTPTPETHSSHSTELEPIRICHQPKGLFANLIIVEDSDNEEVSSLQRSEEA
jgi:hypothetical protein